MPIAVADRSSNKNEQLEHAAESLGRSKQRIEVFRAIYRGKKKEKSVLEIMEVTGFTRVRVLDLGRNLVANEIVEQTKKGGVTAYRKIDFIAHHRDKILRLAEKPELRRKLPTKRRPLTSRIDFLTISDVKLPANKITVQHIKTDDIDSFSQVKNFGAESEYTNIPEKKFKQGIAEILGEKGDFTDWGGELNDLSGTRLVLNGKRRMAAFAFKGPGTRGTLTPKKMGKNGDQIQRLFRCPAEIYIVQYWRDIDDSIYEQMEKFAQLKSYYNNQKIWYCVIDGIDSSRIMLAYPDAFPGVTVGS